jgi:hypothetical protein
MCCSAPLPSQLFVPKLLPRHLFWLRAVFSVPLFNYFATRATTHDTDSYVTSAAYAILHGVSLIKQLAMLVLWIKNAAGLCVFDSRHAPLKFPYVILALHVRFSNSDITARTRFHVFFQKALTVWYPADGLHAAPNVYTRHLQTTLLMLYRPRALFGLAGSLSVCTGKDFSLII